MRRPAPSASSVVTTAVLGLLVAAMLLTSAGAQAGTGTPASYASRLLALVNGAREQHGLQPLELATGTTEVATGWTQHLASARSLSHNPDLEQQLATHGSSDWHVYGENVGVGTSDDPDGLFTAYMKSPEHRANILTADYRYVGVAVVFGGSRAWNTFDFVDAYATTTSATRQTVQRPRHLHPTRTSRPEPVASPHPVAAAVAPRPPQPVRHRPAPAHPARRPAHHPVVHVKALHRPLPNLPVPTVTADLSRVAAAGPLDVAGLRPGSRRQAIVLAVAVLALATGARRWVLTVTQRSA